MAKWTEKNFFDNYGGEMFHLHSHYNRTVSELLQPGNYKMGHILQRTGCYADPWRPYTPLLMGKLRADYYIPTQFLPMSTFQIGVGRGSGVGVPPEQHPSSWFAMVSGTKRWVVHPPRHTTPSQLMSRPSCHIDRDHFEEQTYVCDQEEGDILWLPNFWWHETCGLKRYSIGMGGITSKWSDAISDNGEPAFCRPNEIEENVYSVEDIEYCVQSKADCSVLPY